MNRENWEVKKLGEVCETSSGGTPSRKKTEYYESGTISWLRSGEINQRYINNSELKITELGLYNSSAKIFPKGTVLVAMYGATVGQVGVLNFNSSTNQAICGILPNENINNSFLYYFLKSKKDSFLKQAMGGAQPNISQDIIRRTPLPIPPLPIQEVIVKELDTLHRLKELQEQQLAEYDNLAQSTFYSMFGDPIENDRGWEVKKLGEVCVINPKKSEIKDLDGNTDISFVPMADVSENGSLHLKETKKLNEVWSGFTYFKNNDVLFAKITPCMENGKRTIAKNLINNIGFGSTEFHVLRPKQDVISDFIFYILSLDAFRKIAERNMTGSAGQKRVPKNILDSFEISIPPLPLQSQFADRIEKIEKQKELIKQSITQTQMLIDYTMDKYFN